MYIIVRGECEPSGVKCDKLGSWAHYTLLSIPTKPCTSIFEPLQVHAFATVDASNDANSPNTNDPQVTPMATTPSSSSAPIPSTLLRRTELTKLTMRQLKPMLRFQGLGLQGVKGVLINRLLDFEQVSAHSRCCNYQRL
jgi:hypothetical protein